MVVEEIKIERDDFEYEGSLSICLTTDEGSMSVEFGKGEPEDFCLARDLSDAFSISKMLEMAYNAGKRGETYKFEQTTEED